MAQICPCLSLVLTRPAAHAEGGNSSWRPRRPFIKEPLAVDFDSLSLCFVFCCSVQPSTNFRVLWVVSPSPSFTGLLRGSDLRTAGI